MFKAPITESRYNIQMLFVKQTNEHGTRRQIKCYEHGHQLDEGLCHLLCMEQNYGIQ